MKLLKGPKDRLAEPLEQAVTRKVQDSDFVLASYDAAESERTGYSNYSYWGSTFRCFLKNKVAIGLLLLLALLVAFTFIQPLLPGQFPASRIIDHPVTQRQMANVKPAFTNVLYTVPQGTELIVNKTWQDEEYAAVSNIAASLKAREAFTVIAYGEDWCQVTWKDITGWVKNDFTTKLKLPDDPTAVPYSSRSSYALKIYTTPGELSSGGDEVFVLKSSVRIEDGKAVVTAEKAELRLLPDTRTFLFGTNNAGQDLWALVWSGTRTSLYIGVVVAVLQSLIGIFIGVLWGYVKALDRILTEVYNVIDNIPTTIVLILVSYVLRPGINTLILAMTVTGWVGMARFIRNQIVIIRDRDYNLASRCLGTGTWRIIMRNLLPYLVSVIMLRLALSVPGAIGNEVFITYIGLGLPVSTPSLGNLINAGRKLISTSKSYQLVFPTIVLSIITISFYMIGNAFADAADPKNHV